MAKITCALRKEQIGLLIQVAASYMKNVDKYDMVDILTPLQKAVGDDIIQYAAILPKVIGKIIFNNSKKYKKGNSVDKLLDIAESFEEYDAVEKYLIDNSIIKKETLSDPKADIERRRQEELDTESYRIPDSIESRTWTDEDGTKFETTITTFKDGSKQAINTNLETNSKTTRSSYNKKLSNEKIYEVEAPNAIERGDVKQLEVTNTKIAKIINAKYDAELAALGTTDTKADIERRRQEELSVEEYKPKNTIGYLPIPNKDGSFSAKSFNETPNESSSMFQVEDLGNDRISVSFWNNNRAVNDATSSPELILNPIVRLKDALNQNTNKITTTKPAIFKKQGDKYVLEQMAEMYYSTPTKSKNEIDKINAKYDLLIKDAELAALSTTDTKADVEKRRQEELGGGIIKGKPLQDIIKKALSKLNTKEGIIPLWQIIGQVDLGSNVQYPGVGTFKGAIDYNEVVKEIYNIYPENEADKIVERLAKEIEDSGSSQGYIDKINAKYDAELAALEVKPEKKSTTRTLKKLNELLDKFENLKLADTIEGLEEQLEEVKSDVDDFVNNEEQFGEFNGMLSSLVQSGEAKLKVEAKIKGKIESIKQTEELEKKKQEKKKKEVSDLSKVFDPLSSSSSQQRAGRPSIKGDKVISTQITVWTMLREIIRKGSSPTDAGYYATVMNNTLEDEYLFEDTKEALNNGIIDQEKVTNGKILVITDEKGNIYYFDNNGKVTTKEKGGVPAYQNFRPASDSNRPSKEDLESKGLTEEYERQLNEVKRIRESKEPFTFEIRAITPGYINAKIPAESRLLSDIGENLVISMEGNNTVLTDKDSGNKYTVDKNKLGDTDLIDTIVALLDLENNKGLSEKYSDKKDRRTLIEKVFNTFKPTKDGKSVRLNFENEKIIIVLDGKNLSYEDSIEYIKNAFIDIKSNNLSIGTSFEFPVFRNGEFEMISYTNYRDFISKYTTTKIPQMDNSVSYLKLGDPVIQEKEETKEETKTKDKAKDESANPYILNIKDEGGGLKNLPKEPLKRSIVLLNETTEEQDKKAKEWFDTYLKSSGIKFNDFRDIVNSAALATWTKGAVNLWNQGKYSDLYHEAYHDFSQEFLTKDQKIALYTEAENTAEGKKAIEEELKAKIKYTGNKNAKLSTLEKYHVLEELIAEDFYKYMLSEQKLILNQRPKRNTIFRKMYNFLKELFTGKTDLQTIYERLATNNVSKYERDASKAFFGKLNKKNVEGLTLEDSLSVYKAIDGTIASLFRENNLSISSLFKNKAYLELGLNEVQSTFLKNLNGTKDIKGYSQRLFEAEKEYEKASEEEKENLKPNIAQLKKIVENFSFVLSNWSSIKNSYLKNSRFLKVSSEYLPEDLDSDDASLTKESRYDEQENINAIAKASKQLIYLIASLPAYTNVNGKKQLKMNSFLPGVVDTVDFELTFNQISSALSGLYNYEDQYNKLVSMQKENPELKDLVKSLPNPNVDLTPSLAQLRNQFINIFGTPIVPVKIVTAENENDVVKVNTYNATSNVLSKLKADWDLNLQLDGTHTIKNPSTTQNELDLTKVIKDFGVIGTSIFKENMPESKKQEVAIKFLNAIGFKLSPQAINSPEFKDYLDSKGTYEGIQSIYNSLLQIENIRKEESFNKNYKYSKAEKDWAMQPIRSVLDVISKDKRGTEENSVSKSYVPILVKGLLDSSLAKLSEIELKYSDKFYSDSVTNAGGELVWTKRSWNQLSVMYNTINDVERYPTYQELINSPLGFIFDVSKNPDANNIYLRSVFDLETGIRRKDSKGKYVTLDLYNHNGINVISDGNRTGDKTIKLTRFDKFVQDFISLLTGGNKEHARYGDKSTSNGTETTFPRSEGTARNSYLPVDVVSFKSTVLPEEAWKAFEASLNSAITRTNQFHAEGVGKDFDNYSKNLSSKKDGGKEEYFGFFEGILSKETKDKFLEKGLLTESNFDAKKVTESLKESIKKDLTEFLNKEVTKTKEEIKSNSLLNAKDYTDTFLLKTVENNNETLIRAFAVNAYILNMEHIRLVFTDPRFYDNKNESYTEIFKRMSKASSTGTIGTNDEQINKFLQGTRLEAIKYNETHEDQVPEKAEDGVENTVIFNDAIMTATDFIDQVDERFKNAPLVERVGIKKAYTKAKTSDAFGFCTFDFYRQWNIRTGNDNWNKEKQAIYEKIVNKESLSEDETLKAFAFFPPLKIRVVGFTKNAQGRPIPVDYKFAVSPLVGSVVQGKAFEKVKDNMIRQNVSIGLFKTASKHSSIVNDEGTHNNFYNEDGSVNEKDYVLNPIHTEFIFEVMPSPEDYKGSVSFSTQLRKLLFVNSFKNGVPIDYKGTKDQWDALSESKKRSSSSTYLNKELFAEAIDSLVELEKNKLLDKIGAELKDGKYTYDEEKFSDLLQEEFDKRNLPQNALDSLKVVNGKFKYSLDSSIQRNTIESIIISIVDNKLRKQKGFGESLIQNSSVGYESATFDRVKSWNSINGNDLPFYGYEGRTLPDGTKVTSAQKMKMAIQGDFKKLLNLKDVKDLANNPDVIKEAKEKGGTYTPELVALNRLIRDEKWLDKNNHRELISTTGVRIPVQGHNSMEFMEVFEFLPEEAGPIVIVSPFLVAKSGGDFDWDKITTLFPSIHYNSYTNKVSLYNVKDSLGQGTIDFSEISRKNKQKTEKLNTFKTELKSALEEYKKDKDFAKLAKQDLKRSSRLINIEIALLKQQYDILHDLEIQYKEGEVENIDSVIEAVTGEKINFFETSFSAIIAKIEDKIKEYEKINKVLLPIMERSLTSTYEELAYTRSQLSILNDQLEEVRKTNGDIQDFIFKNNPKKAYNNQINSIIRKTLEASSNFDQLVTPNSTDMFEGIADNIQEYQEQGTKKSYSDIPSNSTSLDQFESNTVGKDSLGIGAIWNVFFSQLQEAGMVLNDSYITNLAFGTRRAYSNRLPHNKVGYKTSVSGIYSQEYKGTKYKISEAISQLMNGWVDVAKKDWIFFINGIKEIAPVMLYTLTTGIHKDVAISFFNQPVLHDFIKNQKNYTSKFLKLKDREVSKNKKAKAIYDTLMKYLPDDTEIEIKVRKYFIKVNARDYLTSLIDNPMMFYSTIGTAFKKLADDNQNLFNPNEFEKFAIPVRDSKGNLTLSKPTTKQEKLAQALYLIQFLEFQEQGNVLNKLRTSINQDSSKPANLQAVLNKKAQRAEVRQQGLFDNKALNHIINNSVIKGFTKNVGGIDDFIGNISEDMFDITNHPVFNDFLKSEWEKSSESTTNNDVFVEGNNIPFETKYEIYDDWVKAFKNDFILYLYQNYIYKDNKKVGSLFFNNWSKWDTAFAAELDSIKLNFPELVENNLLLQFLQRDDSLRKNKNNKPESVSLKLKKSQLESDTIDILSNSFNDLLNFYDNEYTLDQQKEIRDFADKLADFSFVQSGLSKTPYSFSNVIPNDVYADKINRIIKAFKELMDEDATKAEKEIKRFNNKFKENNSKFFVAYYDEQSGGMDIDFAKNETSRGKNYLLGGIVDLLDLNKNANELLAQKENEKLIEYIQSHSSTATEVWDKETAKNNKNNLYIYESNKSGSGMVGTAKVKGDNKNPELNTKGIALMEKASLPADVDKNKDAYFSDSKLTANMAIIDNSIKAILDDIKKRMSENKPYTNIIFPVNGIVEISFLKEKAPLTYNYLIDKLNETFGTNYQTTENTKFEVSQDAEPVIYPSTEEEDDNYRGGYEDNFNYIPSQIDLSEEEQELSMINLEWDKALEYATDTLPKGKTIGEHTQAINKEFQAKVDAIKGTKPSVPTQPSTNVTLKAVASIPQNLVSGIEDFGTKQEANAEAKKLLGNSPHSIDMVEAGVRTRTTRSVGEMDKYNVKVGDIIKQFGKSADGTTKNILTKVTAIHPKGTPEFLGTWNKEGWTQEGIKAIERYKDGAAAIEFEVVTPTQSSTSVESKILNKVGDTITQVSKLKNRTVTLKGTIENIEKTEKGYDVTLKFKTYTGSRLQKVVIENGEVIKTVYKSLLEREKYLESFKNTYNFTFSKSTTPTTPTTQPITTEVVPVTERIRKEYPQTINVNGINLNTNKLLEFSSFGKVTEENGLDDEEIEKYGREAEFVSEWVYLSKEKAEWVKNNPEFSNNLADAYQNDESEEVIEQDLDLDEYSKYLLDKNVRLVDVNQLSLFDKEETDTPNCIIP